MAKLSAMLATPIAAPTAHCCPRAPVPTSTKNSAIAVVMARIVRSVKRGSMDAKFGEGSGRSNESRIDQKAGNLCPPRQFDLLAALDFVGTNSIFPEPTLYARHRGTGSDRVRIESRRKVKSF